MSDHTRSRRALELFDAALDVPVDERQAWITANCDGDAALAQEVHALVAASARTSGVLDAPPLVAMPALGDSITQACGDAYQIVREIGRGGMATVFLAHERKHDRAVVIKVLNPNIAHAFGAERFHREVRIAASLAHPNIVPLIDSGDADGLLYYVMPWMDGETLRARLRRSPLSLAECVATLRDIADALAFAHAAGVVHRDLKPENVLLTGGHAFLLDFGIAKLLGDSSASAELTMPGFPIGTRRYMAPEQAFAAADVDARADIFAWGVLGIELLTDESLPAGATAAVAHALLDVRTDVPAPLRELLIACVSTAPEDRPPDMGAVVSRLAGVPTPVSLPALPSPIPPVAPRRSRRTPLLLGVLTVAVVAVGAAAVMNRSDAELAAGVFAEPITATVLRNETGDSSLAVVGRFAGDWVTDALQRLGGVRVVPWSEALIASDQAMRANAPLVATMRDEAGAGTVLTGTMYKRRDSLQLQAQLIDARSGRLVSALAPIVVPVDRPEDGVAQLRDRVMGAVAAARDERVSTQPGLTRNPPSFSAYQSFDYGLDRFLAQEYDDALAAFREAYRRDTSFAVVLLMGARAAWNTAEFAAAETLVTLANSRRSELGAYHEASLRFLEGLLESDGAAARAAIARASAMAPNSRAGYDHAASLLNAGYAKAARAQLERMDPDRGEMRGWSSYWTQRSHAAYMLGDFAEAERAAREMARRHPDRRVATVLQARALGATSDLARLDSALTDWESLPANVYWSQGAAMVVAAEELMRRGREVEGRRYAERAVTWLTNRLVATPNDRAHRYWIGCALYDLGRDADAAPYFEGLARESPTQLRFRGLAALIAARRGDRVAALRALGTPRPHERGVYLAWSARIAAILGDNEGAITSLSSAIEHGIDGFPWLASVAFRDFSRIVNDPRGRALLHGR